jgi:hypothetical protein
MKKEPRELPPVSLHGVVRPSDCLRAYWSKRERDLMLFAPLGRETMRDSRYLADVFCKAVTDELDKRGYDVTTIRFSIKPKRGEQKFASQRLNPTGQGRADCGAYPAPGCCVPDGSENQ